jgi:hypothetical protein
MMSILGKSYVGALAVLAIAGCEQRMDRDRDRSEGVPPRSEPGAERRRESTIEPRVMPARPRAESPMPTWETMTAAWPDKPKAAAQEIVKKYGPPDEFTASKLMWKKRGQWKRISVSREEVQHDWPAPHTDIVEQFIDMRVPPDKFNDLAKFDGSVIAERTKGEVSARCGGEAANFLALNLANDIATGKRTFSDARNYYSKAMKQKEQGTTDPYLEKLVFEVPSGGTADPDKPQEAAPGGAPPKGGSEPAKPPPADTSNMP